MEIRKENLYLMLGLKLLKHICTSDQIPEKWNPVATIENRAMSLRYMVSDRIDNNGTFQIFISSITSESEINPLTQTVKPGVIQGFLTFDSMYRTFKCDHSLESC